LLFKEEDRGLAIVDEPFFVNASLQSILVDCLFLWALLIFLAFLSIDPTAELSRLGDERVHFIFVVVIDERVWLLQLQIHIEELRPGQLQRVESHLLVYLCHPQVQHLAHHIPQEGVAEREYLAGYQHHRIILLHLLEDVPVGSDQIAQTVVTH
jgi:hypothetical protein